MIENDKNNTQIENDVSFARNSNEAQKIVGNLISVRSQINKYAEGTDYKDGKTLKDALEEKKEQTKITPAKLFSFLLVIPLLIYASREVEKKSIQQKIEEEKKRIKEAINQSIKDGDEKSMMEEMKKMSKQQKYDIMKAAMKEYSSKMSDSFKNMSDDELKRIVNNLDSNIQNCKSLDQLKIDAGAAFVPNAQVAGTNATSTGFGVNKPTSFEPVKTGQVNFPVPNSSLIIQNKAQQLAEEKIEINEKDNILKNTFSDIKNQIIGGRGVKKESLCAISGVQAAMENGKNIVISSGAEQIAVKRDDKGQYQCSFLR